MWRTAEVGPALIGHGDRRRGAWPGPLEWLRGAYDRRWPNKQVAGPLEVSPDVTGAGGAVSPGAGWRCEHCTR
ncbi:hypothetical protein NDU88_003654 [Pleurodeles waltl]|uniref:Uncharacterized protein n=1 Tax=Pleurodeles waltl TaxID=8319 RepID=A0AAV7SGK1_PLEWA|nr:hypothetical protein NDU88_003654 [Pleurodeles waltl]